MDQLTIFSFVAALAGLGLFFILSRLLIAWLQLRRMRFGTGAIEATDRAQMPDEIAELLAPVESQLAGLGFAYENTVLITPVLLTGDRQPHWCDIYRNAANASRAAVQMADIPEPGMTTSVSFSTRYQDRHIQTENRRLHLLFPMPEPFKLEDAGTSGLAEHWAYHCRRLAAAGSEAAPLMAADEQRDQDNALLAALPNYWQRIGFMRQSGDAMQLTATGAWRYLRQILAGNRRLAALPPAQCDADQDTRVRLQTLADHQAWQRQEALNAQNAMPRRAKLLWFAVSALAGVLAFGLMSSWEMAGLLLAVLLLHELGHALAMRLVGYSGLSVLVLPFLGAVAIGRKDDASPWQKMAVLLAGPVPGLILAILCLRLGISDSPHREALISAGALALTINLFNLLPFTPLDGGQLVDTFLFARRPRLRFAFFATSVVALLGLALAMGIPVLAAAALLLGLTIPGLWRHARLLSRLNTAEDVTDHARIILQHLHATPPGGRQKRPPNFQQRMQSVRALLPALRGRAPSLQESVLGIGVYLGALALPVAALWDTGLPQQLASALPGYGMTSSRAEATPPDWQRQLAGETTHEGRWQVLLNAGLWFEKMEQESQARQRFEEALAEIGRAPASAARQLQILDTRIAIGRVAENESARLQDNAQLNALLPELRALPAAERWRLADVLEMLFWREDVAQLTQRSALLREAIAAREASAPESPQTNAFALLNDRVQLARILDERRDTTGAETLLRQNLQQLAGDAQLNSPWQTEPIVWFFIAHDRPDEAEKALAALPPHGNAAGEHHQPLAWAWLAQGKTAQARAAFAEALGRLEKKTWLTPYRMNLLLDLIQASADSPLEEARWLKEAAALKSSMGTAFRGVRHMAKYEAESQAWESRRGQARLAAIKKLPGAADDEEDSAPGRTCRNTEEKASQEKAAEGNGRP